MDDEHKEEKSLDFWKMVNVKTEEYESSENFGSWSEADLVEGCTDRD